MTRRYFVALTTMLTGAGAPF